MVQRLRVHLSGQTGFINFISKHSLVHKQNPKSAGNVVFFLVASFILSTAKLTLCNITMLPSAGTLFKVK